MLQQNATKIRNVDVHLNPNNTNLKQQNQSLSIEILVFDYCRNGHFLFQQLPFPPFQLISLNLWDFAIETRVSGNVAISMNGAR